MSIAHRNTPPKELSYLKSKLYNAGYIRDDLLDLLDNHYYYYEIICNFIIQSSTSLGELLNKLLMKNLLLLLTLFLSALVLQAQSHLPCGTPAGKSEWLKAYQANPNLYKVDPNNMMYVAMTNHVLGQDNGSGYPRIDFLLESFCQLNQDFLPSNIQFYMTLPFNYIDNSAWYQHSTVIEGADMMNANNIPNTINSYFVNDPAGTAGYNLPHADGVALSTFVTGTGDHTWAHEIGHNLSVQHTFLGWEGNTYDFNAPTPTEVYYDYTLFKDTLILDTIIIDTALVEMVPRTNCYVSGDGFCDTPPDYISVRWPCDADSLSFTVQKDPNNVQFKSDGTNYMSYAYDQCQNKFTPEQIAAMRANLMSEKPGTIATQPPVSGPVNQPVSLLSPIGGQNVQFDAVTLEWAAVPNATHYILQVNRLSSFPGSQMVVNQIVSDTFAFVSTLNNSWTFYWKVMPFNVVSTCQPFGAVETFATTVLADIGEVATVDSWSVTPSLCTVGKQVTVTLENTALLDGQLSIFSLSGVKVFSQNVIVESGTTEIQLDTEQWGSGMYLVTLETENGRAIKKLVLTD